MTYRFYAKGLRWFLAVSFDLPSPPLVNKPRQYGCIGIDINPKSIGWSYVDGDGNLVTCGQLKYEVGDKSRGQTKAIIGDVVSQLTLLAETYCCPIVCERLDFSKKKRQLREKGRKYARMLSNFAYSRFLEALSQRCFNLGIELIDVHPAYSSLIGLVKYVRMYGLASDEAAALALARRGMKFSERLPRAITALLQVNCSKHVWHGWSQLNKKLTVASRADYYSISNWETVVKLSDEPTLVGRSDGKSFGTTVSASS